LISNTFDVLPRTSFGKVPLNGFGMGDNEIVEVEFGIFRYSGQTLKTIGLILNTKLTTFPFADLK
jgi:hypothetical protein